MCLRREHLRGASCDRHPCAIQGGEQRRGDRTRVILPFSRHEPCPLSAAMPTASIAPPPDQYAPARAHDRRGQPPHLAARCSPAPPTGRVHRGDRGRPRVTASIWNRSPPCFGGVKVVDDVSLPLGGRVARSREAAGDDHAPPKHWRLRDAERWLPMTLGQPVPARPAPARHVGEPRGRAALRVPARHAPGDLAGDPRRGLPRLHGLGRQCPVSLFPASPETDVQPIRMWSMLESTLDVRTAAVSGVLIATTALFCSSWTGWRA